MEQNQTHLDDRPWLIAMDWQSRALLLAELEERGVEARAEAGLRDALRVLITERVAPPLLIIDTARDPDATPGALHRLLRILEEDNTRPVVMLLVGTFERGTWNASFGERATILVRPFTIGEAAAEVQAKLVQLDKRNQRGSPDADRG